MAISKQVQDALDRIHQTQSLVQSVKQASDLQGQQISTLTDKVTELQAKIDAGGQIGPDDLAGLSEIASDIDTVNAQLQSAIPANTSGQNTGVAGSTSGNSSGSQTGTASSSGTGSDPSQSSDASGSAAASQAGEGTGAQGDDAPKPQPLAGTGQA